MSSYPLKPGTKTPGVKRLWTKPFEVEGIQWTGLNPADVRKFTGQYALSKTRKAYVFNVYAGLPEQPWVGATLYDAVSKLHVPMGIGEWIVKTSDDVFLICDPEELQETYEEM